jgi:coiled-coil alpha-helical rod protein 1
VRREHTKTVVALRQAEHQVSREKEKARDQLALEQKEYNMKLEQLEKKNLSLEKEKNMLVATVRQEGLVAPRTQAKGYNSSTGNYIP